MYTLYVTYMHLAGIVKCLPSFVEHMLSICLIISPFLRNKELSLFKRPIQLLEGRLFDISIFNCTSIRK